jgi:hypothetical protein
MNEAAARNVVLVRAFETSRAPGTVWNEADAAWASRASAEVVGSDAEADRFVARRAALAVERLGERDRAVARIVRAVTWRYWIGWALALAAFALGAATDSIGPAKRVNVLAFPLLGLLVWNLLVYCFIALRGVAGLASERARAPGPIARLIARLARGIGDKIDGATPDSPLVTFGRDWARASAPLTAARVARVLHAGAFAFALGAIAALYLRGLVFEYSAGWESTFLGAEEVRRLLALVLGPASSLTGISIPDVQHLETLRFSASAGENAAPWIHLYAVSIALVVLLPRALLALGSGLAERRLERRLPLSLDDIYFRRLLRSFKGETARVRIVPYSYQLAPQSALGLKEIVTRVFGPKADVSIAPAVPFGDEDALPENLLPNEPLALAVALFSLTATPEAENHGAFVAGIARQLASRAPLAAIVDEAGFRERFPGQAQRLEERRTLWRRMLGEQGIEPVFADLAQPDLAAACTAFTSILDRAARAEVAP